ncbi:MAG: hypothetical protein P4L35_01450 [Ignavibacteriaceae bacterium]|nr:hypothetical protein [Ignavibacteriaceae bacterium]
MRKLTVTLIIIASFNLYGQFVAEDDWPISFKNQFNQSICTFPMVKNSK